MRINQNMSALSAYRNLSMVDNNLSKSLERLSSGLRINRAADDAAGLAISEKMTGQIRGLQQAQRNAQDGVSLIQTAEGALIEVHAILQRMRELAVQAANDTLTDQDRQEIQKEVDQLNREITRIGDTTEFNTKVLLNGDRSAASVAVGGTASVLVSNSKHVIDVENDFTIADPAQVTRSDSFKITVVALDGADTDLRVESAFGFDVESVTYDAGTYTIDFGNGVVLSIAEDDLLVNDYFVVNTTASQEAKTIDESMTFQIGANQGQTISASIGDMRSKALGLIYEDDNKDLHLLRVNTQFAASAAITFINNAIETVSTERSKLGAIQNRLEHTIANLGVATENMVAARSRIQDVDMANAMMHYTKNQILSQAGTAMLAQANQKPQTILQLLR